MQNPARRNVANEILVALVVIVMLLSAAVFAGLLAVVSSDASAATQTAIAQQPTASATPSFTFTPSETFTVTPQPTQPPIATDAPTATSTATVAPASATPTPTVTNSPTATSTPTSTPTPSQTTTPTHTPSPTASHTATATASHTPTQTQTATTISATDVLATRIAISSTQACPIPSGWETYVVQRGDSLLALSVAVNTDLVTLANGNCITVDTRLQTDSVIYVPRSPTSTVNNLLRVNCDDPSVQIISPTPLEQISGQRSVIGLMPTRDFISYRLDVVDVESGLILSTLESSFQPITYGIIGTLDTTRLPLGVVRLRLNVERVTTTTTCDIPVLLD